MSGSRWCPICQGAKRPHDDICLACAITRKVRREDDDRCKHCNERTMHRHPELDGPLYPGQVREVTP